MKARRGTAGMPKRNAADTRTPDGLDFYASPYAVLPPLLAQEGRKLPGAIWEPACGNGALVLPLRNRGFTVWASDLVDRGCPDAAVADFFEAPVPEGAEAIVTNPPFDGAAGDIVGFVNRATDLVPYVAIFARFSFWESVSRHGWFRRRGLVRVIKIDDRLPAMHADGYDGPKLDKTGQCFAWFVFERRRLRVPVGVPVYSRLWKEDAKRFPMTNADVPPTALDQALPLFREVAA